MTSPDLPTKFEQIVFQDFPSLNFIKRHTSIELSLSLIMKAVAEVCQHISPTNTLDAKGVKSVALLILERYGSLTIQDLYLCFKNAIYGEYGINYRLDSNIILSWIFAYEIERIRFAENIQLSNHKENTKDYCAPMTPEQEQIFNNGIKSVLETLPKLEPEPSILQRAEPVKTKFDVIIQRWIRQFDNLLFKYGYPDDNKKFLPINGSYVDLTGYLKYKITKN